MMTDDAPLALPRWLEAVLPEEKEPLILRAERPERNNFIPTLALDSPGGGSTTYFYSVEDLVASKKLDGHDLLIDPSALELFGSGKGHLKYDPGKEGYHGFLMSYTDARRRKALEQGYGHFLEALTAYEENSEDFYSAWNFVDSHPAFWTAHEIESYPWHWETTGYCSKIRQHVSRGKRGFRVELSGGGHVEHSTAHGRPAYSEHYGDWRLEAQGGTFEEAMVDFAHRVWLSFDSEGNSLSEDSFPYEAPEWIRDLRAAHGDED